MGESFEKVRADFAILMGGKLSKSRQVQLFLSLRYNIDLAQRLSERFSCPNPNCKKPLHFWWAWGVCCPAVLGGCGEFKIQISK